MLFLSALLLQSSRPTEREISLLFLFLSSAFVYLVSYLTQTI